MNDAKLRADPSRGRALSPPLRRFLRLSVDERAVQRMWHGIAARSPALAARERRPRVAAWAGLVVALVVVLGFVVWDRQVLAPPPGVLLTSDGVPFEGLEAAEEDQVKTVALAEGSRIEVSPGARVEALASTPSELVLLVRRGRARFSVTPGGPRRWLIETPAARVEVVGTILSVEAAERSVRVHVEEGAVLVRSAWLPDAVRRLEAGHSLSLEPPEPAPAEPRSAAPVEPSGLARAEPPPSRAPAPARETGGGARARKRPNDGDATRRLWADADRARRAGQPAAAARLLERLLREHPEDEQAALGAFTLGALYADELGQPEPAAQAFRRALALGIPSVLRDACYVRWAESARAAGDVAGVRRAAEEYAKKYPTGEQLPALQALLDDAPRSP